MKRTNIPCHIRYNLIFIWVVGLLMPTLASVFFFRSIGESVTYFVGIIFPLLLGTRLVIRRYGKEQVVVVQNKKHIFIEYRKGILYFIPEGGSRYQFSDIIAVPDTASDEEKTTTFWKALELAGKDQPRPKDWKQPDLEMQAFLDRIQLKTWGTYDKYVLHSSIKWDRESNTLSFSPSDYDRGAFCGKSGDPFIEIPADSTSSEIVRAIRQTLENCTGRGGLKLDASFKLKSSAKESEPICYGVGFGYKNKWLVFKTQDPMKVAERLEMKNPQKTDWETGINAAYELSVFITPPIGDWVLAVGGGLSDYSPDDETRETLEAWSQEFGEVQFFSTHRVVEAHCWIKAVEGRIVRAYSWIGESGETEFNEGTPTAVEQGRNLIDTKSPEAEDDGYWERDDIFMPGEEFVMTVAGSWSVDPMDLEGREGIAEFGLLGKVP